MANVIHGHFDSALSLHKQIVSLSTDTNGQCNDGRLIMLYAGAIAECLLDYEDWKDGLNGFFDIDASFEDSLDAAQWFESSAVTQSFYRDRDAELGRSVVRSYLDDHPETSFLMLRNIQSSLMAVMDDQTNFWRRLHDMTCTVLVTEQIVHNLCDQIIDISIGGEGWTLGDCVQAMGALSGQYYARSMQTYNLGRSQKAVVSHGFDYMVHTIMNEALRLGMDDHVGMHTMIPANDTQPYVPFSKADQVDMIAGPLFRIFKVADANLKSLMIAKATGRMMAVAAAGDRADMDCCVVTPLALTSMRGSYHHCLGNA